MILTLENVETLSTEQLAEIVWEMYKSVHGVRPRFMSTREEYLDFLRFELRPEVQEMRQQEWDDEAAYYKELEEEEIRKAQQLQQQEELALDYPGKKYEHLSYIGDRA